MLSKGTKKNKQTNKKKEENDDSNSMKLDSRVGTLLGIGLVKFGLISFLFVNKNNGAKYDDLTADTKERPKCGEFVLDPK